MKGVFKRGVIWAKDISLNAQRFYGMLDEMGGDIP